MTISGMRVIGKDTPKATTSRKRGNRSGRDRVRYPRASRVLTPEAAIDGCER